MRTLGLVALLLGVATVLHAEDRPAEQVTLRLEDGTVVVGWIVEDAGDPIVVRTSWGTILRVPRSAVVSLDRRGSSEGLPDPNDSRLLFAPTGRPMRKGFGQISDYEVLFPGVSYGVTDNLTLMGGMSIVPGFGIDEQLVYFAPKIGARVSDRFALSAGYLFARVAEEGFEEGAGVGFAVATVGGADRNLTVGFGVAHAEGEAKAIVMLGGQRRLGRRIFFLTENWLVLDEDIRLGDQPFSAGLRFCGDRLSVDFGLILVGTLLEEGVSIPWLSFSYQFGGRGGRGLPLRGKLD